jgi:hypothetical protein
LAQFSEQFRFSFSLPFPALFHDRFSGRKDYYKDRDGPCQGKSDMVVEQFFVLCFSGQSGMQYAQSTSDKSIVVRMRADPEPGYSVSFVEAQHSMAQAYSCRPEVADLFKV